MVYPGLLYYSISCPYFIMLNCKWKPHTCDLFSTKENNKCSKLFSLHWCRGISGLTVLVSVVILTNVGYMPRSALSERFGENSKSKELELLALSRFEPLLHGGS
jgi:hypothetical protein